MPMSPAASIVTALAGVPRLAGHVGGDVVFWLGGDLEGPEEGSGGLRRPARSGTGGATGCRGEVLP